MSWFKVDDHLHSHRKAMRAGTAAMGLWVLAGSWSGAEESDGWVPSYVLTRLAGVEAEGLAERLVAAGLWHVDQVDGEDGYRFHEWETCQPTKAQLERKREAQRERMRAARSQGGDVSAHKTRTASSVTPTPTRPDPTPKNTEPDGFPEFWALYPRKTNKANAAKAYAKAIRDTDPDTIGKGLANAVDVWTAARTEDRFIPHASTWLNARRWEDEQPTLPTGQQSGPTRPTKTLAQCGNPDNHDRHDWGDERATYVCMGA